ncbi:uncharacterized protein LOC127751231 [Frankliniella occidentalis]|uniref:Uncharacterized protein LOC127751231 n=1 Tax=Frankliniella occidentalis TaxID=133901 RepID=A0A9C6X6Y7_FRAOC|nr:uncharacterized protein LOC127751231 [Frankliniella occidentalis]
MADCKRIIETPMETKLKPHLLSEGQRIDAPYQELMGRLIYLTVNTRPDMSFSASFLSQYNTTFTEAHWTLAKRVLKYLKATSAVGLTFTKSAKPTFCVIGYADADFEGNSTNYKSFTTASPWMHWHWVVLNL